MAVTRDDVVTAYRMFLDRLPSADDPVKDLLNYKSIRELRTAFLDSQEFYDKNKQFSLVGKAYELLLDRKITDQDNYSIAERSAAKIRSDFLSSMEFFGKNPEMRFLPSRAFAEPNHIDIPSAADLNRLFEATAAVWAKLGKAEPHWSVCTADKFRQENLQDHLNEFYGSGNDEIDLIKNALLRCGQKTFSFKSVLEIGCGVGRISFPMSRYTERLTACDLSVPHLDLARQRAKTTQTSNIDFKNVVHVGDYANLGKFDLIFSVLVLQHNPPPVIEAILDGLMGSVQNDGYLYFQVPTYCIGYTYDLKEYLKELGKNEDMEMHVMPQDRIFALAAKHKLQLLEVRERNATGHPHFISNDFLFWRPRMHSPGA